MKSDRTQIEQEWKKIFKTDLPKHIHKAYAIKYLKWQKENNQITPDQYFNDLSR